MKYQLKNAVQKGFSLVEMLIVIAVIGIIAAIAIPNIGNINQAAKTAKDKRNAQSIANVFQAGAAAGVVWPTTSQTDAINAVVTGAHPTDGPFANNNFSVPNIVGEDLTNASNYLQWSATLGLVYAPGSTDGVVDTALPSSSGSGSGSGS